MTKQPKQKHYNTEETIKAFGEKQKHQTKNNGLTLAQQNKDFHGYTVFTFKFNEVPIRFVTEKDAEYIVKKELDDLQEAYNISMKEISRLRGLLGYDKNKSKKVSNGR